ncbi:hypothetical protein [Yersinia enterocolitica]|nr:hypothetical protein [Yersinia enterocolitica]HDL6959119.1 hypothetical protein [Yersinia enterocolitica]HDL6982538.1 hypothetical protein [Yersinia enterocolitica]HDL7066357.1 hypothetical protein [Yersinia enterocolitica]HDL7070742.1 hypothetical protein [Yersinia enterocolitica]
MTIASASAIPKFCPLCGKVLLKEQRTTTGGESYWVWYCQVGHYEEVI